MTADPDDLPEDDPTVGPPVDWLANIRALAAKNGVQVRPQQPAFTPAPTPVSPPMPAVPTPNVGLEDLGQPVVNTQAAMTYAANALASEIGVLLGTTEGQRNHQLNVSAMKLGQLVAGGNLNEAQVRAELTQAALKIGLTPYETKQTIDSGIKKGLTEPRSPEPVYTFIAPTPPVMLPTAPVIPPVQPPASSPASEPPATADLYELQVEHDLKIELRRRDVRRRASRIESSALFTPPAFADDLAAELDEPDPDIEWTIENLHSVGGNTTITAGFKVGKTTFMMNLVRALADGTPFLGTHEVRKLDGRIAFWNHEVEAVQMRRNLREINIHKPDRVWHVPLRGHHLDLMDDAAYTWAVAEMRKREIEAWILDPFSGAFYGDENSNSDINAFTKRLDEFKREAGIADLFMPVHTGRYVEEGNERARGGAKLDDWTDNRWVLAKHADSGDRYFRAEGRRVEQEERELKFDRPTQTLTYSPFTGTRKTKATSTLQSAVLAYVTANPGCTQNQITGAITGQKADIRAVIKKLINDFDLETRSGKNNATHHFIQGSPEAMSWTG
ncbi:AAA family ATPase [Kribbella solani]|uniref:AAA domain-containing protein n=1 Tax=Kribbella solani TaxID=236067 RepID=A0A841E0A8_9ACTN|nr:AAA family ATPase [Kribbella solani]MBB5982430.1 hypothetical protein [Kribbella solani]